MVRVLLLESRGHTCPEINQVNSLFLVFRSMYAARKFRLGEPQQKCRQKVN